MILDVRQSYSALIRYRPGGAFSTPLPAYATVPIEIVERRLEDCPVVLRYSKDGRRVAMRGVDGSLHLRLARPKGYADDVAWLKAAGSTHRTNPDPFERSSYSFHEPTDETTPGITLRKSKREDAVAALRANASDLALLDGEIWVRRQEPTLRATTHVNEGVRLVDVQATDDSTDRGDEFRFDQGHLVEPYYRAIYPDETLRFSPVPAFVLDATKLRFRAQERMMYGAGVSLLDSMRAAALDRDLPYVSAFLSLRNALAATKAAGFFPVSDPGSNEDGSTLAQALESATAFHDAGPAIAKSVRHALARHRVCDRDRAARLEAAEEDAESVLGIAF